MFLRVQNSRWNRNRMQIPIGWQLDRSKRQTTTVYLHSVVWRTSRFTSWRKHTRQMVMRPEIVSILPISIFSNISLTITISSLIVDFAAFNNSENLFNPIILFGFSNKILVIATTLLFLVNFSTQITYTNFFLLNPFNIHILV